MAPKSGATMVKPKSAAFKDKSKPADVRTSNINAAKGECLHDTTSLKTVLQSWKNKSLQENLRFV